MALVLWGGTEQAEQGYLAGFQRVVEIVPTVKHEHGDLHVRRKIDRVCLRQLFIYVAATGNKHCSFEALLDGGHDRAEYATPTDAEKRKPFVVDIRTSLKIVYRATQILRLPDGFVSLCIRTGIGRVPKPLIGIHVNGKHERSSAFHNEIDGGQLCVFESLKHLRPGVWKVDDCLVGCR